MLACPRGRRTPCRRSGSGALGRPEWEGLSGFGVPDTLVASCRWWARPHDGSGTEKHQVWETQAPEHNREPGASLHAAVPRLPGAALGIKDGANPHCGPRSDPSQSSPRRPLAARAEPCLLGRGGAGTARRGPTGVWGLAGRERASGEGAALSVQEALPRTQKGQVPGPGRSPGREQSRGGVEGRPAEEVAAGAGRPAW